MKIDKAKKYIVEVYSNKRLIEASLVFGNSKESLKMSPKLKSPINVSSTPTVEII